MLRMSSSCLKEEDDDMAGLVESAMSSIFFNFNPLLDLFS